MSNNSKPENLLLEISISNNVASFVERRTRGRWNIGCSSDNVLIGKIDVKAYVDRFLPQKVRGLLGDHLCGIVIEPALTSDSSTAIQFYDRPRSVFCHLVFNRRKWGTPEWLFDSLGTENCAFADNEAQIRTPVSRAKESAPTFADVAARVKPFCMQEYVGPTPLEWQPWQVGFDAGWKAKEAAIAVDDIEQMLAHAKLRKARAEAIIAELKAADALNEYVFADFVDGNKAQEAAINRLYKSALDLA